MPVHEYGKFLEAMIKIKAEEALVGMDVVLYPTLAKKEDREKLRGFYQERVNKEPKKTMTGLEMAKELAQWRTKKL